MNYNKALFLKDELKNTILFFSFSLLSNFTFKLLSWLVYTYELTFFVKIIVPIEFLTYFFFIYAIHSLFLSVSSFYYRLFDENTKKYYHKSKALVEIKLNWQNYFNLSDNLKNDLDIAILTVSQFPNTLKYMPFTLRDHIDVVKAAVLKNANILKFASDRCKDIDEIAMIALQENTQVYHDLSQRLKENRTIILYVINLDWRMIKDIPEKFRADREIALIAVKQSWKAMKWISNELEADDELYSIAKTQYLLDLQDDHYYFEYASDRLKNDPSATVNDFDREIWEKNKLSWSLKSASIKIKDDLDVILDLVKENGKEFEFASERLQNHHLIILAALAQNIGVFNLLNSNIKNNFSIICEAINLEPNIINKKGLIEYYYTNYYSFLYEKNEQKYTNFIQKIKNDIILFDHYDGTRYFSYKTDSKENSRDCLTIYLNNRFIFEFSYLLRKKDITESAEKKIAIKDFLSYVRLCYIFERQTLEKQSILRYFFWQLKRKLKKLFSIINGDSIFFILISFLIILLIIFNIDRDIFIHLVKNGVYHFNDTNSLVKDSNKVFINIKEIALNEDWENTSLYYAGLPLRKDKEIALLAIKGNWQAIKYIDPSLYSDVEIYQALKDHLIKKNQIKEALEDEFDDIIKNKLKNDIDIAFSLIKENPEHAYYIGSSLKKDIKFAIEAVKKSWLVFKYIDQSLKNHKSIALELVKQNASYFKHFNESIRNDKEIALYAVKFDCYNLEYLNQTLQNDQDIYQGSKNQCIEKITVNYQNKTPINFKEENEFPKRLKNDPDIIALEIMKQEKNDEEIYENTSNNFELEILSLANTKDSSSKISETEIQWENVSTRMLNDKTLFLRLLKRDYQLLANIGNHLKNDKDFFVEVLDQNWQAAKYMGESLKNDKDIYQIIKNKMISEYSPTLKEIMPSMLNDEKFVLEIIKKNIRHLEDASIQLRNNKNFMLEAIKINYDAIKYIGDDIQNDENTYQEIKHRFLFSYLKSAELIEDLEEIDFNDKYFFLKLLEQDAPIFKYSSDFFKYSDHNIRDDEQVVIAALNKNWENIAYVSDRLKNDKNMMLHAIGKNLNVSKYLGNQLKDNEDIYQFIKSKMMKKYSYDFSFNNIPPAILNERDIFLHFIKNPSILEYASEEIKNDEEIILEALKHNEDAINYAGDILKNNKDFMKYVFKNNKTTLRYISKFLDDDDVFEEFYNDILNIIENSIKSSIPIKKIENDIILYQKNENEKENEKENENKISELSYAGTKFLNNSKIFLDLIKKYPSKIYSILKYAGRSVQENEVIYHELKKILIKEIDAGNLKKINKILNHQDINGALHYSNRLKSDIDIMSKLFDIDTSYLKHSNIKLKNDEEQYKMTKLYLLNNQEELRNIFNSIGYRLKSDKSFILMINDLRGIKLSTLSEELKNDQDIVQKFVNHDWQNLGAASSWLQENDVLYLTAKNQLLSDLTEQKFSSAQNNHILDKASIRLRADRDIVFKIIPQYPLDLQYVSENLKNDKELVLLAIQKDWNALAYASDQLKNDDDIYKKIKEDMLKILSYPNTKHKNRPFLFLKNQIPELKSITKKFLNERDIIKKLIENHIEYDILDITSLEIKDDDAFMKFAVTNNWKNLQYASTRLQNQIELSRIAKKTFLEESKNQELYLKNMSQNLRDDIDIARIVAVNNNPHNLFYLSPRLKDNDEIAKIAINHNYEYLQYISDRLRDNENIVLQAIRENGLALEFASDRLRDNENIVLQAIRKNGLAFKFASDRLRDNENIVFQAIRENGWALEFASDRLRDNENIVFQAIKTINDIYFHFSGDILEFASDRIKDLFIGEKK